MAAGVLTNDKGEILVTQRSHPPRFRGKWEFPGGKVEARESIDDALRRELFEELGVTVLTTEPLIAIVHRYAHATVRLHVRKVVNYEGRPLGKEGQALQWVSPAALHDIDFLDANEPILNAVRLPHVYMITDSDALRRDRDLSSLQSLLGQVKCMVQLRRRRMDRSTFEDLALQVIDLCHRTGTPVLTDSEPARASELGFDGVHFAHLPSAPGEKMPTGLTSPGGFWIGASCSGTAQIDAAQRAGVDFIVVPAAAGKGEWSGLTELCAAARVPLYALGDLNLLDDLDRVRGMGAQGIAITAGA